MMQLRRNSSRWILPGLVWLGVGLVAAPLLSGSDDGDAIRSLRDLEKRLVGTVAAALPAVVFVDQGSGVVISADGLIVTNDHVVGNRKKVDVRFALTGRKRSAGLLGRYPGGDLALLQIEAPGSYPYLELGDSDALVPGQRVLALGNPFLFAEENPFFENAPPDFHPSVSLGVVSALHRNTPPRYPDAVQVDVAVNPGNSGGPLVTLAGEVVGVNGKIETRFGISVNSGVGYAVSSRQIQRFLEPLKNAGGDMVTSGDIFGLEIEERPRPGGDGLRVKLVVGGSHAERAGFRVGDRILSIDQYPVPTRNRYSGILQTYPVGSRVGVRIRRDGEERELTTVLEEVADGRPVKLGIRAEPVSDEDETPRISSVTPDSPAERSGLEEGDVILELDGTPLRSIADLITGIRAKRRGDVAEFHIRREDQELDVTVLLREP